ncbi:MAG: molybdenum cofactor guanylyltransferase [Deltaproteobacteria bacterium]|nr:molybdenum cofactor guanylyltransferase [Deltaproteobacteria bacterium]
MGGLAKGLLRSVDEVDGLREPIVARTVRVVGAALGANAEVVLVGHSGAYGDLGLPEIADAPEGVGPMGGFLGACLYATERMVPWVLLLGCDMPFVSASLLDTLSRARGDGEGVDAVTPCAQGHLQPLCTFYRTGRGREVAERQIARGRYGLTELLRTLEPRIVEVAPQDARWLRDWDTPNDVLSDGGWR